MVHSRFPQLTQTIVIGLTSIYEIANETTQQI